jgi:hypothetical protein
LLWFVFFFVLRAKREEIRKVEPGEPGNAGMVVSPAAEQVLLDRDGGVLPGWRRGGASANSLRYLGLRQSGFLAAAERPLLRRPPFLT